MDTEALCDFIEDRAVEESFEDRDEADRMVGLIDEWRETGGEAELLLLLATAMRYDTHPDYPVSP